jgi:hydrogenase maturation factor
MCLTIPKKVVAIAGPEITVENRDQSREQVRSLIEVAIGDFVVVENNIIIEKINQDKINEFLQILET